MRNQSFTNWELPRHGLHNLLTLQQGVDAGQEELRYKTLEVRKTECQIQRSAGILPAPGNAADLQNRSALRLLVSI